MQDGIIHFYRDSALNRVLSEEVFKVDEDKVAEYEAMCETYRDSFMEMGWLRLHTPVDVHQEYLGTDFLYVPPSERARITQMLKGGTLATIDRFKTFHVIESRKNITIDELIGSGELVNLSEIGEQNRDRLERGVISEEEMEKQAQVIQESKFYFIFGFIIEGMFIQRKKTRLEKIFG